MLSSSDEEDLQPLSEVATRGQKSTEELRKNISDRPPGPEIPGTSTATSNNQELDPMEEDAIAGFTISVFSRCDNLVRRELNSHMITTRAQLFRALSGISLKRCHEDQDHNEPDAKRLRAADTKFNGTCHHCGDYGNKTGECRKRREASFKRESLDMQDVKCFSCCKMGYISPAYPEKKQGGHQPLKKTVNICERSLPRSALSIPSGETIPFLLIVAQNSPF